MEPEESLPVDMSFLRTVTPETDETGPQLDISSRLIIHLNIVQCTPRFPMWYLLFKFPH
jgi:hypothetical protein